MMAALPKPVTQVTGQLIELLDKHCPGQLSALYLVGSLALNDYQPGRSDIDFVAVFKDVPDIAALSTVHAVLAQAFPRPFCDGLYLTASDLDGWPAPFGPYAREGQVDPHSAEERHPVTWVTLVHHGIALRGQLPATGWIAADRDAARRHSRENLARYWRPWLDARKSEPDPSDDTIAWGVLGVTRLHAAITTSQMLSKSGAGAYAMAQFPGFAPIIAEALRLRAGEPSAYRSQTERRQDMLTFIDTVIASAA